MYELFPFIFLQIKGKRRDLCSSLSCFFFSEVCVIRFVHGTTDIKMFRRVDNKLLDKGLRTTKMFLQLYSKVAAKILKNRINITAFYVTLWCFS